MINALITSVIIKGLVLIFRTGIASVEPGFNSTMATVSAFQFGHFELNLLLNQLMEKIQILLVRRFYDAIDIVL